MCTQSPPKGQKILTKEDFIIPEGWKPTSQSLKRIIKMSEEIVDTLGPTLVREILEEAGVIQKGEPLSENHNRR